MLRRARAIGWGGSAAVASQRGCSRPLPWLPESHEGTILSCLKKILANVDPAALPTEADHWSAGSSIDHQDRSSLTILATWVQIWSSRCEETHLFSLLLQISTGLRIHVRSLWLWFWDGLIGCWDQSQSCFEVIDPVLKGFHYCVRIRYAVCDVACLILSCTCCTLRDPEVALRLGVSRESQKSLLLPVDELTLTLRDRHRPHAFETEGWRLESMEHYCLA